jgi:hypothetical protein
MFATLSSRPMVTMRRLKKLSPPFIGVLIFLVSSNKSNDLLIFTLPLAIMATNHIEIPQIKLKQEMVLIVLIACLCLFLSRNYNLVPYDKSPASPSPVQYNCARLVCHPKRHPKMASIRQVFSRCAIPLGQQLQRQYEFLLLPSSINLLNTAMIDCPVASIGSTSNKYLLLKSAIAIQH